MGKGRLEAFSDGVIAILITIMVLELKVPLTADIAALRELLPVFLSYVLSFAFLGIYWNNHHHLLQATTKVNGAILWANLHLLFWLSLTPFVTGWMGENAFAPLPMALYGVNLFLDGLAYGLLQHVIIASEGRTSLIASALANDKKTTLSTTFYALAIPLAFVSQWLAGTLYVIVALMWFIPDQRIESVFRR